MIEKAIHQQWAATAGLTSLIPAASFTTGSRLSDPDTPLPAAVLMLENTTKRYVNTHHLKIGELRIKVWVRDHDDGVAVRQQIETAFNNTNWSTDNLKVIVSRVTSDEAIQEDDGVWQFIFDLSLIVKNI